MTNLAGSTALITGAGSGIGRVIAARFVAAGAQVVFADVDGAAAQAAVDSLADADAGRALAVACDVADAIAVGSAFDAAERAFGVVDVVVNNAGIYYLRPFLEMSVEDWDRIFTVNVRGLFLCMQDGIRRMVRNGCTGSIINISSVNSRRALIFDNIHYSATKAAVNGITASAALEFAEHGIRINAILPGSIVTGGTAKLRSDAVRRGPIIHPERVPLGRRGEPGDIAAAALYLASAESSYVTGQLLAVDGGFEVS